jgi:hypothetical protein
MAFVFDPTGSDLKSTTGVAALVEVAQRLQLAELAVPEANRPNNVQVSYDLEGLTTTVAVTLPVEVELSGAGVPTVIASNYLNTAFVPGTSDLNSTNLPAATLEMAYLLESAELAVPEATRPNNITIAIADGIATIGFTGPVTYTVGNDGKPVITTFDYL